MKKIVCAILPQLYRAKQYLKSGVEKYEERAKSLTDELSKIEKLETSNGVEINVGLYVASALWTATVHDTPFLIVSTVRKSYQIESELKEIESVYETVTKEDTRTVYEPALCYSTMTRGNKHYIIGSMTSTIYNFLYDNSNFKGGLHGSYVEVKTIEE